MPARRVAGPPREFEQPEAEDDAGAARSRRTGARGRLGARRHRDRPRGGGPDREAQAPRSRRSGGRSRHRRHQLLLWTGVAVVVIAFVAVGVTAFLTHRSGPSHTLVAPSKLGSYVVRPQLEKQMNGKQLQQQVIAKSAGQASHVVSAVYEDSAGVAGKSPPQIILLIGGNLAGVSPSAFITSFTDQFKGAQNTSAGSLGGEAACVNAQSSAAGSVALCTWADSDTFGVVASPTMGMVQLAAQMRTIRPEVERPAR
jgi:hypothetical protein